MLLPVMVLLKLSNCFWHPDINVNLKEVFGQTPLSLCCWNNHVSVIRLLLKDSIESFIAGGRDLGDVENKKGRSCTAL